MTRQERDSLGVRDVPSEAYYGIQTLRAVENFPVSGRRERPELITAYAIIKKAAAITNAELGVLDRDRADAIIAAADEVLAGKFADQFPVDIFQAGAGTSFNMNVNEVIANRALEILGHQRGDYAFVNPNDHVNLGQSTNDTFPTACHIAIVHDAQTLDEVLTALAASLRKKGQEFLHLPKTGRHAPDGCDPRDARRRVPRVRFRSRTSRRADPTAAGRAARSRHRRDCDRLRGKRTGGIPRVRA